jgi:hypothetical protein
MWKVISWTMAISCFAVPAHAQKSLCSLLPQTDVSSVLGTPMKLSESAIETNSTRTGSLRSQTCNYGPPGGIGSGPATARVTISEVSPPTAATQMFKAESQTLIPMVAGKAQPLSGLGEEAVAFPAAGSVYVRKKNVLIDIAVGLRDLNRDKEIALGKELAAKATARIP